MLNLTRIGPNGKENRDQDQGNEIDGNMRDWKPPNGGAKLGVNTYEGLQHDANVLCECDESPRTHRNVNAWASSTQLNLEKDKEDSFNPPLSFFMKIMVWKCRGALSPNFCIIIMDMMKDSNPDIFIVTETKVGGDRTKEITNKLPFDGVVHTDTIGYAGGL